MAWVLQRGRTRAAPTPRAGQMAPKIQADLVRWSLGALGRVPRFAQRRVILVFCPTLASSLHDGWKVNSYVGIVSLHIGFQFRQDSSGPGLCLAAAIAASPYMRSGLIWNPYHNASCTRNDPGRMRPTCHAAVLKTIDEDGRIPRFVARERTAGNEPYVILITTPSGISPVSVKRQSMINSLRAIATIAIRRVRPCKEPTRSRNHLLCTQSG